MSSLPNNPNSPLIPVGGYFGIMAIPEKDCKNSKNMLARNLVYGSIPYLYAR